MFEQAESNGDLMQLISFFCKADHFRFNFDFRNWRKVLKLLVDYVKKRLAIFFLPKESTSEGFFQSELKILTIYKEKKLFKG